MALELDVETLAGLTPEEARRRLDAEGFNELPSSKPRSIGKIVLGVLHEPMFILLLAAGAVYLLLGDREESLMLLGFVFVIIGITFYQERKTERALEALRDLSSPRALVIRGGEQARIPGRDVVRGDILLLAEGDRVPADAVLLSSVNLTIDESLLTGESVPVQKLPWDGTMPPQRPGGDGLPFVYSGTLVTRGKGVARVLATGLRAEMGKIGTSLRSAKSGRTLLQKETDRLVRNFALTGALLCVLVVAGYGLTRHDWLGGFLAGLTLAMATIPEEFPVVLTVFLALGAWRIAKKRVLTRQMTAVETLGSCTALCVDKTGTLTLNRMRVREIVSGAERYVVEDAAGQLPECFHGVLEFGMLASQQDPFDPMERAVKDAGERMLAHTGHVHRDWALVREYPLDPRLLAMSRVWNSPDGREYVIASKGAPEAIIDLCHLPAGLASDRLRAAQHMAERGLRVLGVAKAHFSHTALPGKQHDFSFVFVGLVGFEDPLRPGVADAVAECFRAGIRVIMITGDYPVTAQNIARHIGLRSAEEVVTGAELETLTGCELGRRIKTASLFARVVPEQKLRIVNALKANGDIVAMTGDGVNDSPALKAADIGIAMGGRGTDVAREAAALVLLDDDFSSLVQAVKQGRRIYDNLKKAMAYILAVHVPIAGMSLVPVLFKLPLVLQPVHIVFLELIIDPVCSIVFEAEPAEPDIMGRPPRDPKKPVFGKRTVIVSLLQGASVFLIVLAVYAAELLLGRGADEARTLTFTTLVISNAALILTNRSWSCSIIASFGRRNAALWAVLLPAGIFLSLVLYVPFLRRLFRFTALHASDILICLGAGIFGILWFEILKMLHKRGRARSLDE